MAKKKTKKELFTELLAFVEGNAEYTEFINNEIALLDKQSSNRKPTARQNENEELAVYVTSEFERLSTEGFITQKDFHSKTTCDALKGLTPQRLGPILNKLVAKNVLIKSTNSKKEYVYALA